MPTHHNLEQYLDEYFRQAGIADQKHGPLFRTIAKNTSGRQAQLTDQPMKQVYAWKMVQRRMRLADIAGTANNHTFRATGITSYLENGGTLEKAQQMAAHSSPKTTKLYDRTSDQVSLDEVERIGI